MPGGSHFEGAVPPDDYLINSFILPAAIKFFRMTLLSWTPIGKYYKFYHQHSVVRASVDYFDTFIFCSCWQMLVYIIVALCQFSAPRAESLWWIVQARVRYIWPYRQRARSYTKIRHTYPHSLYTLDAQCNRQHLPAIDNILVCGSLSILCERLLPYPSTVSFNTWPSCPFVHVLSLAIWPMCLVQLTRYLDFPHPALGSSVCNVP